MSLSATRTATLLLPPRPRGTWSGRVARVVSWPLTLLWSLVGSAWRLLALLWVPLGPLCVLSLGLGSGREALHAAGRGGLGALLYALVLAVVALLALAWTVRAVRGWFVARRRFAEQFADAGTRWRTHAGQSLAYLAFRSDELPRWNGSRRLEGASFGPWHEARVRLARRRIAVWAWIGVALYLMVGIGAQVGWLGGSATDVDKEAVYTAPGWFEGPYFLGTDRLGHSVGAMALKGTAVALWVGSVAAVIACLLGGLLGAVAGYFGGWVDALVVWLYTTLESIPEMLLVLAFAMLFKVNEDLLTAYNASFLQRGLGLSVGLFGIVVAIGLTSWTGVARQIRGEFIRQRDLDYVLAARALGVPTSRIVLRHVFPNVTHLLLISFSLLFIGAIKYEVVLTFLGVGVEPGDASWGRMINDAKVELLRDPPVWWQLTGATVMLFGLALSVNLFVDALRDALDPRLRD